MVYQGNTKWAYTSKDEVTSPTDTIESVLLTETVYSHEGCDVDTIDIPNKSIKKHLGDTYITIILKDKMADLMSSISPKIYFKITIIDNKGNVVLYTSIIKTIYGKMKAASIFYLNLVNNTKLKKFSVEPF